MEPERRIEKWLRAFAKKRREQAGAPLELRSPARQRLHHEISRRSMSARGGGFFANFFSWLHPQVAFALSALVIVTIGIWMVFPLLSERKPSTLAAAAVMTENKSASESNRRARAKNAPASEPASQSQPAAGSAPMVADRELTKQADAWETDAPVATSPAPAPGPTAPTTFAAAEKDARKKPVLSKQSAPAAAGSAYMTKGEAVASAPVVSQVFNRVNIPAVRTRATGTLAVRTPLLASFRVEQNGEAIRIVDADGSVYTGAVQVLRREFPGVTGSQVQTTPNYFFRVAGTNRNLNRNLVFSGNFIPLTNALFFQTNAGGGARSTTPELLSNSRIAGSAVIGDQKAIEVNATPAR